MRLPKSVAASGSRRNQGPSPIGDTHCEPPEMRAARENGGCAHVFSSLVASKSNRPADHPEAGSGLWSLSSSPHAGRRNWPQVHERGSYPRSPVLAGTREPRQVCMTDRRNDPT